MSRNRHQHYLLNHTAEIVGDTAHAETYYLFGTDRDPANHLTSSGGRYVDRLERPDGRWAIVARVCVVEWITESTSSITEDVIGILSAVQTPTKDRTDPSYARPLVVTSPSRWRTNVWEVGRRMRVLRSESGSAVAPFADAWNNR